MLAMHDKGESSDDEVKPGGDVSDRGGKVGWCLDVYSRSCAA